MRSHAPSALLVDEDRAFLHRAGAQAQAKGFEVMLASTIHDASTAIARPWPLDLLLIDLMLPDGSGVELIDRLDGSFCVELIAVTGCPEQGSALQPHHLRIDDYMVKPVEAARLDALLDRALHRASLRNRQRLAQCGAMSGAAPCMQHLFELIRRIAPTDHTVLLYGESGTGKELAAQALHALSGRRGRFVAVNCGAMPPDLLGSLLFGHERGSFTGATREHAGFFEQAQHGTLLLDEFTEMPPPMQAYLLRALENRSVTRLGAQRQRPFDVRVIAACNREPHVAVREGQLRPDVYYRLCEFPIALPPLRTRGEDAVLLALQFLERLNDQYATRCVLTEQSLAYIRACAWPGNVRELKHAVQRAYLMAQDERVDMAPDIGLQQALYQEQSPGRWHGQTLEEIEREAIEQALRHCGNDKTRAARLLGVSVKTIYNKLLRYRDAR